MRKPVSLVELSVQVRTTERLLPWFAPFEAIKADGAGGTAPDAAESAMLE